MLARLARPVSGLLVRMLTRLWGPLRRDGLGYAHLLLCPCTFRKKDRAVAVIGLEVPQGIFFV